jgi:hypothetical protein
MEIIVSTKGWLSSTFEMEDMGEANYMLGVKILRDRSRKLLGLSQETYIKKVFKRLCMHNSKPIGTLFEKGYTMSLDHYPKHDEEKKEIAKIP